MNQREPKKNETLEIRIPSETKVAFMEACRLNGISASRVLRECIDRYLLSVPRAPQSWKERLKGIASRVPHDRKALSITVSALTVVVALSLAATPLRAAPDPRLAALFEWMDTNRDSQISPGEFQLASQSRAPLGAVSLLVSTKARSSIGESGDFGFQQLDVDRNAALALDELVASCVVQTVVSPAIVSADSNRDGAYTEGELAAYLGAQRISEGRRSLSSAALMAKGIILAHDSDGDGDVTLADLRG